MPENDPPTILDAANATRQEYNCLYGVQRIIDRSSLGLSDADYAACKRAIDLVAAAEICLWAAYEMLMLTAGEPIVRTQDAI